MLRNWTQIGQQIWQAAKNTKLDVTNELGIFLVRKLIFVSLRRYEVTKANVNYPQYLYLA